MGQMLQQMLGGGMAGGGAPASGMDQLGMGGGAQQPQVPPPQGGPESLMTLLSNLMLGGQQGPAMPGQGGLNTSQLGFGSLQMLLPLLLQALSPPQQGSAGGGMRQLPGGIQRPEPGGVGGAPGTPGAGMRQLPGAMRGGGEGDPGRMATGLLGQLGLV